MRGVFIQERRKGSEQRQRWPEKQDEMSIPLTQKRKEGSWGVRNVGVKSTDTSSEEHNKNKTKMVKHLGQETQCHHEL